jgi:Tol biopolymer transport system component
MSLKNSLRLGAVVIAATAATFALAASSGAQVVGGPTTPKATHIAFMSKADGEADIYAMTANGVARTNLTDDRTVGLRVDSEPAWSPDGQYVVFQRTSLKTQVSKLYVVRTDGRSDPHALVSPTVTQSSEMDPYWAPNGRTIVFSSNRTGHFELYMVDATGGAAKQLTFTRAGADNLDPAWSPDGLAIAFARHEWNTTMPSIPTDSIYVLWLRTGQIYRITNPGPGKVDGQPAWSADSSRIAFESNRAGTEDVYVSDYKGNALRRVTPLGSNEFHPTWASFGSQIALVSDRTGATEIYTLTIGPNPSSVPPMTQLTFDKAPKANPAWERAGMMSPAS